MKFKASVCGLALLAGSLLANPVQQELDHNARQLLTVVFTDCPIPFIQAMKGADRVGRVLYTADRNGEAYEISTVADGFAPVFHSYDVATLKIVRKVVPRPAIPDRPAHWQTACELTSKYTEGRQP
ncbi:MAG: hypothetical protein HYZ71_06565 [Deltaproteobacteria bacterium]|nr:hypothetical protein [Deltaproteobacteria bacterium]